MRTHHLDTSAKACSPPSFYSTASEHFFTPPDPLPIGPVSSCGTSDFRDLKLEKNDKDLQVGQVQTNNKFSNSPKAPNALPTSAAPPTQSRTWRAEAASGCATPSAPPSRGCTATRRPSRGRAWWWWRACVSKPSTWMWRWVPHLCCCCV